MRFNVEVSAVTTEASFEFKRIDQVVKAANSRMLMTTASQRINSASQLNFAMQMYWFTAKPY